MRMALLTCVTALWMVGCSSQVNGGPGDGWISLFDGKSLEGWRASENPGTFRVENGTLVVDGPRAHLYYVGPVMNHEFRNFEWKADVMTTPGSNSGMYFHTAYEDTGWPSRGYEVQVNTTHTDWRRTGSLYAVQDVREVETRDNEWFTQHVIVQGKRVQIKVNGKTTVDYTEPEGVARDQSMSGRRLGSGTVAIQGHDPASRVYYRNIMIRPLPD